MNSIPNNPRPDESVRELHAEIQELREQLAETQQLLAEVAKRVVPLRLSPLAARAAVGEGCRIDPTVRVLSTPAALVTIEDGVTMYGETEIIGPARIGEGTFVNRSCYIRKNTTIGKRVNVGPFARFITDTHEIGTAARRAGKNIWPAIQIGDGAWIGAGATIMAGVRVGDGAIVAAGAVVTRDVPAHALVAGVPARVIRELAP